MSEVNSFSLLSSRNELDYFPLQVVYEWEDIVASECKVSIDVDNLTIVNAIFSKPINQFLQKIIRNTFLHSYFDSSFNYFNKNKYIISFLLNPIPLKNHYLYRRNVILILLDVFSNNIDMIPEMFDNELIFVTNIEVLNYFKSHQIFNRLRYIPLSISDIYYDDAIPSKVIDIVQIGRQNTILHEWMLQLIANYPEIEYVYSKMESGKNVYISNIRGTLNDPTETRSDFMRFLGSAKISLVSSPGVDGGGENRTGNFNPVTPRFYESAVKYCYMIGRFPDSPDFLLNDVKSVCERPNNYKEFEQLVLKMLSQPFNKKSKYDTFIKKHLTSTIAKDVKIELDKIRRANFQ